MLTIKVPTSLIKFKVRQHLSWPMEGARQRRFHVLKDMLELHTEETISVDEELFKLLDL